MAELATDQVNYDIYFNSGAVRADGETHPSNTNSGLGLKFMIIP